MNNIGLIVKKELKRFFGDKRMIFSSIIFPILMMYILYSFMGSFMGKAFNGDENPTYNIAAVNMPASMQSILGSGVLPAQITTFSENDLEQERTQLKDKNTDLVMVFPQNFDEQVAAYTMDGSQQPAPNIELFYNSSSTNSAVVYQLMLETLDGYEASLVNKFDVNRDVASADVADKNNAGKMIISAMMPFLIVFMLFSMCMSTASESIAGEKERGTMATLLATPIKRSDIVAGKVIGMSITSVVSAVALFLGIAISLPNYLKSLSDGESIGMDMYSPIDFVWILLLIVSLSLLFISFVSILSTLANSSKEAATYTTPFMGLIALATVFSAFSQGKEVAMTSYLIPVYNVSQLMSGIFSGNYTTMSIVITVVSNLVYAIIFVQIISVLFKKESVMFKK